MIERKNRLRKLESLLSNSMLADRYSLRRELRKLKYIGKDQKAEDSENVEKRIQSIEKRIKKSVDQRVWRATHIPKFNYNHELPIVSKKDKIISLIKNHQVVIISGETGSGKTTQIPKFCLAAGRGLGGIIGCTQPRRIAATTVANRIAEEMNEKVGQSVGYKIRFREKSGRNPFIKIMTDGILLAETQNDSWLNEYDTIIVDEAHERSLNIDFVLGILRKLLIRRKDLKLIITSATIDTDKFSKAFDQAPIIEVTGRMYPVEVRY